MVKLRKTDKEVETTELSEEAMKKKFTRAENKNKFVKMEKNAGGRKRLVPGVFCLIPEVMACYFGLDGH